MRDIKFRAWFRDTQEMKRVATNNLYKGDNSSWLYLSLQPASNYRSVEVMQYTGLKDKNGVEIYEGDIVKVDFMDMVSYDGTGVVTFVECGYYVDTGESLIGLFDEIQTKEVLGNVFEHPKLLKGEME